MSDGNDGAGGVGGSNGGSGSAGNDTSAADAVGNAAGALGAAADSLSAAISDALGAVANGLASGLGLDGVMGQIADALGLDVQDLQGLLGAAVLGGVTGGLAGAVMGVVNSLAGGSLAEAARDAVAQNLPTSLQPLANAAIDQFASTLPGTTPSLQGALASFASGALSNGKAPDLGDLSAVARSLGDLQSAARGFMDAATRGDFTSAAEAVSALDGRLAEGMAQMGRATSAVGAAVSQGHTAYAQGGHGSFGNAVEQLAVDTARLMANR